MLLPYEPIRPALKEGWPMNSMGISLIYRAFTTPKLRVLIKSHSETGTQGSPSVYPAGRANPVVNNPRLE
jgi:hypothetical protein